MKATEVSIRSAVLALLNGVGRKNVGIDERQAVKTTRWLTPEGFGRASSRL
jgi:hypothetical protein